MHALDWKKKVSKENSSTSTDFFPSKFPIKLEFKEKVRHRFDWQG